MSAETCVAIMVISDTLSLLELEARLGPSGPGSHSKGDVGFKGRQGTRSIWCIESQLPGIDLATQCASLIDAVKLDSLGHEAAAILDIAVYFESPYAAVALPVGILQMLGDRGIGIEITCYPVREDVDAAG